MRGACASASLSHPSRESTCDDARTNALRFAICRCLGGPPAKTYGDSVMTQIIAILVSASCSKSIILRDPAAIASGSHRAFPATARKSAGPARRAPQTKTNRAHTPTSNITIADDVMG